MEQADEQQLYNILLLVEEQQKAAAAAVAAIAQERLELAATADMLKQAATLLPKALGEASARAMRESMSDAQKTAVGSLNQARGALVEAFGIVRDASTWVGPRIALAVALSCALLLAATYGIGCHILSSTLGDIEALRAEQAVLQENVRNLEARGGKARLSTCGGRLCIEVSTNQGKGFEDWHGSPWTAANGARMMILRGY